MNDKSGQIIYNHHFTIIAKSTIKIQLEALMECLNIKKKKKSFITISLRTIIFWAILLHSNAAIHTRQ